MIFWWLSQFGEEKRGSPDYHNWRTFQVSFHGKTYVGFLPLFWRAMDLLEADFDVVREKRKDTSQWKFPFYFILEISCNSWRCRKSETGRVETAFKYSTKK
jgi:hypothetical protein